MHFFTPQALFDLSQFTSAELFNDVDVVWKVFGKMKEYLKFARLGQIEGRVEKGAWLINPEMITIGRGSVVESGAYIRGPCIIGEECEVRSGAYIRGNFITGKKCVIGHSTEVKNVLFLDGVKAGHFNYIGDSIIGNRVNFGAGSKCANVKLDESMITLSFEGEKINTGLKKLGAIIGDDVHLGCNAVLNPGTIMGKKSGVYPCLSIKGIIRENHVVKREPLRAKALS